MTRPLWGRFTRIENELDRLWLAVHAIRDSLIKQGAAVMADWDEIKAALADNSDRTASIVQLVHHLLDEVEANVGNPDVLTEVLNTIRANTQQLADATASVPTDAGTTPAPTTGGSTPAASGGGVTEGSTVEPGTAVTEGSTVEGTTAVTEGQPAGGAPA